MADRVRDGYGRDHGEIIYESDEYYRTRTPARHHDEYSPVDDRRIQRYREDYGNDDRRLQKHRGSGADLSMVRYDDRYNDERRSPHRSRSLPDDRRRYRDHERAEQVEEFEKSNTEYSRWAATIVGGIAGGLIGRKASRGQAAPTLAGVGAGAWAGYKIEKEYSKHEQRHDDRRKERRYRDDQYSY